MTSAAEIEPADPPPPIVVTPSYNIESLRPPISPVGGDTYEDGQQHSMSLGVELTGYRLLTTSIIVGLGIPKAIYSSSGQSLVSPTLDWVGGTFFALVLFWLGVIEAKRPELFPCFFQVDLAPPVLKFLCRHEVQLWCLSILPLSLTVTQLRAMLLVHAGKDDKNAYEIPAHLIKDVLTLAVLAFSVAICVFCIQCLRLVRPRGFRASMQHRLLFIISAVMWLAYNVYLVVRVVSRSSDFPRSIIKIAVHNTLWTFPFTLLPISKHLIGRRESYLPISIAYDDLIKPAIVGFLEAVFMGVWGLPDFPEGLYGVLFLGGVAAFFLGQFLSTVSIPRDLFTRAGSTSKAIFHRVQGAGRKSWSWTSALYNSVRNGVIEVKDRFMLCVMGKV